ncbi:unnamed protein product [Phytophthora fragariaefolia]|uniref:Unnamed protein product n=1 Tax=Phytophthora fragariaefolia TaxID=1490495 RepID=A0A9W6XTG2_9STRA|nr:unnamed protein product [Phytophthora fragariaefolia]
MHLQQQRYDVEAEQATWAANLQQRLNAQMEIFQEKIRVLEEARNLDQATLRTLRKVHIIRSRNTHATSPQVKGTQATCGSGTDSATSPKSVTGHTAIARPAYHHPERHDGRGFQARAGPDFRKSNRKREQHLRQFVKNLWDDRLNETLQSQRFRKVSDMEYILKQRKYLRQDDGPPARPPQQHDFRADNVVIDRYKPKRQDRAYVDQAEVDASPDDDEPFHDSAVSRVVTTEVAVFRDGRDASSSSPPFRCDADKGRLRPRGEATDNPRRGAGVKTAWGATSFGLPTAESR